MDRRDALIERLYGALHRISGYASVSQLHRNAARERGGISGDELVEMAYENVISEAKAGIKGVRRPRRAP